jgi:endoglucanase
MEQSDKTFLEKLLSLSSPTGNEQEIQRFLHDWAKPFAHKIETDYVGNLAVVINPEAKLRIMLAGHCDRIGFMVMQITDLGFLRIDALGGIDKLTMLGAEVIIQTKNGEVTGVIGKTSTHLQTIQEQGNAPSVDTVWIDIGAKSKEDAEKLVEVGDFVTYKNELIALSGPRIAAPALDNILGLYAIMKTARNCAERGIDVALYCVSTAQEEIGSRGAKTAASAIQPHVAIAVDTTLANDTPAKAKTQTTPDLKLDAGPSILKGPNSNPIVTSKLIASAQKLGIPFQMEINAKTASNDAKEMQLADSGTAAGSVGIPLRNMHTQVEVASLDDLEYTVQLLTDFVTSIAANENFFPINHHGGNEETKAMFCLNEIGSEVSR